MRTTVVLMLLVASPVLAQDPWAEFHPEAVKSFECTSAPYTVTDNSRTGYDAWEAIASAKREGMPNWGQTLGTFEYHNPKEYEKAADRAQILCMRWRRKATEKVHEAHKGR